MILRKYLIAATGLFLCIFLIVHLSANMILILPTDIASPKYNAYAAFLADNALIKVIAYLLYLSIILHVIYALIISLKNRSARKGQYSINHSSQNSTWISQNMGLLGILILIFIVVHLGNFWAKAKLGIGEIVPPDKFGNKDLYSLTAELFSNPLYAVFYTFLMIPLGFHLNHGLKSAFKSLGFYHRNGLKVLEKASLVYAILIASGFGIIPLIMFLKSLNGLK